MPKATLTFTLPDEREDYENAVNGAKYKSALQNVDNWLRSQVKYQSKLKPATRDAYRDVRAVISDEARDGGVEIT